MLSFPVSCAQLESSVSVILFLLPTTSKSMGRFIPETARTSDFKLFTTDTKELHGVPPSRSTITSFLCVKLFSSFSISFLKSWGLSPSSRHRYAAFSISPAINLADSSNASASGPWLSRTITGRFSFKSEQYCFTSILLQKAFHNHRGFLLFVHTLIILIFCAK